jgi:putative hydrolase of the HAD superfamily
VPERPLAILFDLGNVVLKLKTEELITRISENSGKAGREELLAVLRAEDSPHHNYERGRISGESFYQDLKSRFALSWTYGEWLERWNDYFLINRPMEVLIAKLRPQARIWALSNTNAEHLSHLRRNFRVFDAFEGFVASHEVHARKPEPEIYFKALERLGLAPSQIAYLDDVKAFTETAAGLGIHSFHYHFNDLDLKAWFVSLGFEMPEWERLPSALAC